MNTVLTDFLINVALSDQTHSDFNEQIRAKAIEAGLTEEDIQTLETGDSDMIREQVNREIGIVEYPSMATMAVIVMEDLLRDSEKSAKVS